MQWVDQAGSSPKIENYLGFPEGIKRSRPSPNAPASKACRFGAEILVARAGRPRKIVAGKGIGYPRTMGRRLLLAPRFAPLGSIYRRLGPAERGALIRRRVVYYGAGASEAIAVQ